MQENEHTSSKARLNMCKSEVLGSDSTESMGHARVLLVVERFAVISKWGIDDVDLNKSYGTNEMDSSSSTSWLMSIFELCELRLHTGLLTTGSIDEVPGTQDNGMIGDDNFLRKNKRNLLNELVLV